MKFTTWLKRQRDRDDPVGDLSRDARRHERGCKDCQHRGGFPCPLFGSGECVPWAPFEDADAGAFLDRMIARGASALALRAAEEAWQQYSDDANKQGPGRPQGGEEDGCDTTE